MAVGDDRVCPPSNDWLTKSGTLADAHTDEAHGQGSTSVAVWSEPKPETPRNVLPPVFQTGCA